MAGCPVTSIALKVQGGKGCTLYINWIFVLAGWEGTSVIMELVEGVGNSQESWDRWELAVGGDMVDIKFLDCTQCTCMYVFHPW